LNFLRHYRPLQFFGGIGLVLLLASVALFAPVLITYLETGLVPRMPTLMTSVGLAVISALAFTCGLILDTTMRAQLEVRRLIYLNVG
jgi:hypothetical protein